MGLPLIPSTYNKNSSYTSSGKHFKENNSKANLEEGNTPTYPKLA
jgi:hypothetical protein